MVSGQIFPFDPPWSSHVSPRRGNDGNVTPDYDSSGGRCKRHCAPGYIGEGMRGDLRTWRQWSQWMGYHDIMATYGIWKGYDGVGVNIIEAYRSNYLRMGLCENRLP